MIKETLNCVRCGKPAEFWTGHVDYWKACLVKTRFKSGNKGLVVKPKRHSVMAGWCSDRCYKDQGFRGTYQPWMGSLDGEQPSPCKTTTSPQSPYDSITSPERDNVIYNTLDQFKYWTWKHIPPRFRRK